jgi:sugar phosphate isomerase/epimerase
MEKLKFSYFQRTFGQEETYLKPEKTYHRLKKYGCDAIELCPPKGRYGLGVSIEKFLSDHKALKDKHELDVSCLNECRGEMWDPYSPNYKTLTNQKTADLAVDFKAGIKALKKMNYSGYCTIESAPMIPDSDTAAKDGIDYLKFLERIAEYQISSDFPNGFPV